MLDHLRLRLVLGLLFALASAASVADEGHLQSDGCAKDIEWADAQFQRQRYGENDPTYRAMKQKAMNQIHNQLVMILDRMTHPSGLDDGPVRRYADNVHSIPPLMQRAKCWDAATEALWLKQATPIVEKARLEAVAAEDKEAKCRSDPKCMSDRILAELCPAIDRRAEVDDSIRENLRYAKKTGVINLSEQNDLSDQLKDLDRRIAKLKSDYRDATHKPFSAGLCRNQ